jgi:hypothetical protein
MAGIVIALSLCSHIQISLYVVLGSIIYAIIRGFQFYSGREKNKEIISYFSFVGMAFVIGFGLAAVQLVPFAELASLSQRIGKSYGYRFQFIDFGSFLHLISFIIPNIYGNPVDGNYWGEEPGFYMELGGYIGILPLILAGLAIYQRKDKSVVPFLAIAIFALLIYLRTPLLSLLFLIPGYNRTLGVGRIIFLYIFSMSVLASFGADYLDKGDIRLKVRKVTKFLIKCLFIGAFFFLLGNLALQVGKDYIVNRGANITDISCNGEPNLNIIKQNFFKNFTNFYIRYLKYYNLVSPVIYVPFLLTVASIWIFVLYLKKGPTIFTKIIICFIILADLFYFGMRYIPTVRPQVIYPELEVVKFLKRIPGPWRAMGLNDTFPPNTLVPYEIQNINGYGSLFLKRYAEFISLIDKNIKLQTLYPYWIQPSDYNSILIDLLNVKYLLTSKEIEGNKFRLIYNKDILVYENTKAFPRAFVVPKAIVIKDKEEILKHLGSSNFKPSEYVILEEEPHIDYRLQTVDYRPKTGEVTITRYSPHSVSLEADLPDAGFLVLSDTYYPGWKVYVDGKEDRILRANYIMRAVRIEKGHHKVDFIYDPISFKVGRNITLLTLISIISYVGLHLILKLNRRKR